MYIKKTKNNKIIKKFKLMPVNCQINLRVEKKVPQGETAMAHTFPISVGGQKCSVSYSNPRERAVKAYVVPSDINAYNGLPKKAQKEIQHAARTAILKRL